MVPNRTATNIHVHVYWCSSGAPAYGDDWPASTLIYIAVELGDGSLDVTIVNHVSNWPMSLKQTVIRSSNVAGEPSK